MSIIHSSLAIRQIIATVFRKMNAMKHLKFKKSVMSDVLRIDHWERRPVYKEKQKIHDSHLGPKIRCISLSWQGWWEAVEICVHNEAGRKRIC